MKKYIIGFMVFALIVITHMSIQAHFQTQVVTLLEKRTLDFEKSSGQQVSYSYGDVSLDYFTMSMLVSDVQLQIGEPSIAIVNLGEYRSRLFSNLSELTGVDLLVQQGIGGAVSLLKIASISLDDDHLSDSNEWTYFSTEALGIVVSEQFYVNFLPPQVGDVIKIVTEDNGFGLSLTLNNTAEGEVTPATLGLSVEGMFNADFDFEYHIGASATHSTPIDPATGKVLSTQPEEGVVHMVHSYDIRLEDFGVRDVLFAYGGSFTEQPSITDAEDFKNTIVSGLDSYVNQVVIAPTLPMEAMNRVVSWVDKGGVFSVNVKFDSPVPVESLWSHLFGYPQIGIYENAAVEVGE